MGVDCAAAHGDHLQARRRLVVSLRAKFTHSGSGPSIVTHLGYPAAGLQKKAHDQT